MGQGADVVPELGLIKDIPADNRISIHDIGILQRPRVEPGLVNHGVEILKRRSISRDISKRSRHVKGLWIGFILQKGIAARGKPLDVGPARQEDGGAPVVAGVDFLRLESRLQRLREVGDDLRPFVLSVDVDDGAVVVDGCADDDDVLAEEFQAALREGVAVVEPCDLVRVGHLLLFADRPQVGSLDVGHGQKSRCGDHEIFSRVENVRSVDVGVLDADT